MQSTLVSFCHALVPSYLSHDPPAPMSGNPAQFCSKTKHLPFFRTPLSPLSSLLSPLSSPLSPSPLLAESMHTSIHSIIPLFCEPFSYSKTRAQPDIVVQEPHCEVAGSCVRWIIEVVRPVKREESDCIFCFDDRSEHLVCNGTDNLIVGTWEAPWQRLGFPPARGEVDCGNNRMWSMIDQDEKCS